jgi:purine-nucleoside phosphorylase
MATYYTREQYEEAAAYIRDRSHHRPRVGLILGSGLNPLAESAKAADVIPFGEDQSEFPRGRIDAHQRSP